MIQPDIAYRNNRLKPQARLMEFVDHAFTDDFSKNESVVRLQLNRTLADAALFAITPESPIAEQLFDSPSVDEIAGKFESLANDSSDSSDSDSKREESKRRAGAKKVHKMDFSSVGGQEDINRTYEVVQSGVSGVYWRLNVHSEKAVDQQSRITEIQKFARRLPRGSSLELEDPRTLFSRAYFAGRLKQQAADYGRSSALSDSMRRTTNEKRTGNSKTIPAYKQRKPYGFQFTYAEEIEASMMEAASKVGIPKTKDGQLTIRPYESFNLNQLDDALHRDKRGATATGVLQSTMLFGDHQTASSLHLEDYCLGSMNLALPNSAPKVWLCVGWSQREKLTAALQKAYEKLKESKDRTLGSCRTTLGHNELVTTACTHPEAHKAAMIDIELLQEAGIEYTVVVQQPMQLVITAPGTFHQVANFGVTCCEAVNWGLPFGWPVDGYSMCECKIMVNRNAFAFFRRLAARIKHQIPLPTDPEDEAKQRRNRKRKGSKSVISVKKLRRGSPRRVEAPTDEEQTDENEDPELPSSGQQAVQQIGPNEVPPARGKKKQALKAAAYRKTYDEKTNRPEKRTNSFEKKIEGASSKVCALLRALWAMHKAYWAIFDNNGEILDRVRYSRAPGIYSGEPILKLKTDKEFKEYICRLAEEMLKGPYRAERTDRRFKAWLKDQARQPIETQMTCAYVWILERIRDHWPDPSDDRCKDAPKEEEPNDPKTSDEEVDAEQVARRELRRAKKDGPKRIKKKARVKNKSIPSAPTLTWGYSKFSCAFEDFLTWLAATPVALDGERAEWDIKEREDYHPDSEYDEWEDPEEAPAAKKPAFKETKSAKKPISNRTTDEEQLDLMPSTSAAIGPTARTRTVGERKTAWSTKGRFKFEADGTTTRQRKSEQMGAATAVEEAESDE
ncbi:Set-domain histone methyltransferase-8 [Aphelenchoides fujianensis]|nr:Set-domain histone methyltransferase-8 [Aphelenchoides fujianensis]